MPTFREELHRTQRFRLSNMIATSVRKYLGYEETDGYEPSISTTHMDDEVTIYVVYPRAAKRPIYTITVKTTQLKEADNGST